MRALAFGMVATACILHATDACADVSSWMAVGGGYGLKHNEKTSTFDRGAGMSFSLGVGSDPLSSVVIGGMLRSTTYFDLGTDLGLALRVATGGFARGQWGLAVDAGAMWRSFGHGEYGRWPFSAMLIGGAPWGLQLGVGSEFLRVAGGDAQATGFVALLEMDLLRLTVMRQGATDHYWENPAPAGGRKPTAKLHPLAGLLF